MAGSCGIDMGDGAKVEVVQIRAEKSGFVKTWSMECGWGVFTVM